MGGALYSVALFALVVHGTAAFLATNAYAVTSSSQFIQQRSNARACSSSQLRMVLAEPPALESIPAVAKKPVPNYGETGT
jgi:hypothetical protein